MASIQFKGKGIVQGHHLLVPFHALEAVKAKGSSKAPKLDDNLIVHGDNLLALKALLPTYAGKVKCIYIDPPYNTGNEGWAYNDNVNNPMMQQWLKDKVVDKDDLTRHDKWLCMMMPRLKLLREMLTENGIIFISIGDDEVSNLGMLLREVFEEESFVGLFVWKSRTKPTNAGDSKFKPQKVAEYVFAYAKGEGEKQKLKVGSIAERSYSNFDKEKRKKFRTTTILTSNRGVYRRESMRFNVGGFQPPDDQRWKAGYDEIKALFDSGRIGFHDGIPHRKHFEGDEDEMLYPAYTFIDQDISGTAENGKAELGEILGKNHGFDTVKPVGLIKYLLSLSTGDTDIILDSFAGSGTTAQATLELNREDGGNRRFILVETENYANKITAERVRCVSKGVKGAKDEALRAGLGGTFSYFELGKAVDADSLLTGKSLPTWDEMARYVFHTATGEAFDAKKTDRKTGRIGETAGREVYLIYEPNVDKLKDLALTTAFVDAMGKPKKKIRLVFAPTKYLALEDMDARKVEFAQLPFEIYRRLT